MTEINNLINIRKSSPYFCIFFYHLLSDQDYTCTSKSPQCFCTLLVDDTESFHIRWYLMIMKKLVVSWAMLPTAKDSAHVKLHHILTNITQIACSPLLASDCPALMGCLWNSLGCTSYLIKSVVKSVIKVSTKSRYSPITPVYTFVRF